MTANDSFTFLTCNRTTYADVACVMIIFCAISVSTEALFQSTVRYGAVKLFVVLTSARHRKVDDNSALRAKFDNLTVSLLGLLAKIKV